MEREERYENPAGDLRQEIEVLQSIRCGTEVLEPNLSVTRTCTSIYTIICC